MSNNREERLLVLDPSLLVAKLVYAEDLCNTHVQTIHRLEERLAMSNRMCLQFQMERVRICEQLQAQGLMLTGDNNVVPLEKPLNPE